MRNIKEYPITREEIIACLEDVISSLIYGLKSGSSPIGDMRPLLLRKAIDIIQTGTFDPN